MSLLETINVATEAIAWVSPRGEHYQINLDYLSARELITLCYAIDKLGSVSDDERQFFEVMMYRLILTCEARKRRGETVGAIKTS